MTDRPDEELINDLRQAHGSQVGFSDALMEVQDRLMELRLRIAGLQTEVQQKNDTIRFLSPRYG